MTLNNPPRGTGRPARARHFGSAVTVPLDCGHPATLTDHAFTNGIARTAAGWTSCYRCAYDDQVVDLLVRDTIAGYLSLNASGPPPLGSFTTWPGEILGAVTALWTGSWRWSANGRWRMRYVEVRDLHGQRWRGHGSDQYDGIRLRKITTRGKS
ncbi:hypothetical protein [Actinomadura hibisca]|uniref:hypothetical protein n=1 Tax=Actinomadura hibisca TaxID=68565 RepID=UPI00082DCC74|nr:hypothetical protein [Actinomadura hibisca]